MRRKRLFYDIETSPCEGYFWRPGNKVRIAHSNITRLPQIICVCWKWEGQSTVHKLHWGTEQTDKELIKTFLPILNEADESVAHNGDNFDLKWIRGRCVYHDIPMRPSFKTIDTYKKARSVLNLPSYKLDFIADYMGFGNKVDVDFSLWKEILQGDKKASKKALNKMVNYCKHDVRLLELVHDRLKNYTVHNTHYGTLAGREKYSCPECSSRKVVVDRRSTTAMGTIRIMLTCNDCNKYYTVSNKTYMELLSDRQLSKALS